MKKHPGEYRADEKAMKNPKSEYGAALREAKQVGAANSKGDAYLAQVCSLLQFHIGPGINSEMVFLGAKKRGINPPDLLKMSAAQVNELMYEGMGI